MSVVSVNVLLASSSALFAGCLFSAPGYRGPRSSHFDGERFFNPPSIVARSDRAARNISPDTSIARLSEQPPDQMRGSFGRVLTWWLTREPVPWPEWVDIEPGPKPAECVHGRELRVTFVNHATLLIQMPGLNILTDPVWSERVGPLPWLGLRRVHAPGLRFEDLPPIDLVLLSHNHYDHLDLPTLRRLMKAHAPKIAGGLGTARFLRDEGVRGARDFDWWHSVELRPNVRITSVPARHFAMRGLFDQDQMLWTGWVVSTPSGSVYFAGDTGYGTHFREVGRRFIDLRVAILPIGAYLPRWFMAPVHIDPAEAIAAHLDLGVEHSVGMHFGTFNQADEGRDDPVRDLRAALLEAGLSPEDFVVLQPGDTRSFPSSPASPRERPSTRPLPRSLRLGPRTR